MSKFNKTQVDQIRQIFNAIDTDGSGAISVKEFQTALTNANIEVSKEEIIERVNAADKDGSGTIDFNEFLTQLESEQS